jgi:hypothetical protein
MLLLGLVIAGSLIVGLLVTAITGSRFASNTASSHMRWLRALPAPGLMLGVLLMGCIALASVPVALIALIGFGRRLLIDLDWRSAASLLGLMLLGFAPIFSLRTYWLELQALLPWDGWRVRVVLVFNAAVLIVLCWFGSRMLEGQLERLMVERPWRPGGVVHRIMRLDLLCEVSCRDTFFYLYRVRQAQNQSVVVLERNFALAFGQPIDVCRKDARLTRFLYAESPQKLSTIIHKSRLACG